MRHSVIKVFSRETHSRRLVNTRYFDQTTDLFEQQVGGFLQPIKSMTLVASQANINILQWIDNRLLLRQTKLINWRVTSVYFSKKV